MDQAAQECWENAAEREQKLIDSFLFIADQERTITELSESLAKQERKKKRAWIIGTSAGAVFGVLITAIIK